MKPELWHPKIGGRGMTALHYAAYCQDVDAVCILIQEGADITAKDEQGWTALNWCIDMAATGEKGAAERIVDILVKNGASLEYQDSVYPDIIAFAHDHDSWVAEHIERIIQKKKGA